ncbi:MAG: hypothetical protein Q6362_008420 [Candidatus Wukongarchaeota archaeon]|nr:hypothetical protein [Candidatus Wukongarchaeota archaeon]MDO8129440.1 hypothetical protein [Candidatus Wukongarchaeota archaeon]
MCIGVVCGPIMSKEEKLKYLEFLKIRLQKKIERIENEIDELKKETV